MFGMSSVLDGLELAIDEVIASEQELELPRLRQLVDRLEAAFVHQVRAGERGGALDSRHLTPAGALAAGCRMPFGAAERALLAGQRLEGLPETAAAALTGEIRPDHVRVITDACTPRRAEAFAAFEAELVEVARGHTARALQMVVRRVCDAIDGDDGAAAAADLYGRRHLHVSRTLDDLGLLDGVLDLEGTEVVVTALEHRMAGDPDALGEPRRTRPQRRADALVDVCRHYLLTHDQPVGDRRRSRPQVGVIVDLELLEGRAARAVADVRGELLHTGAVATATLHRLTCDAGVHRILTDGRSEVRDVGRSTRTISSSLWRASVARDGHCRAPGCDQAPGWCEAHHVVHWARGGTTDLANLQLLCWRHHRAQHEGRARASPG